MGSTVAKNKDGVSDSVKGKIASKHQHSHLNRLWKARLFVCFIMLALAFIGLIIMDLHSSGYWVYSRIMALSYAILSIWLFWYCHRGEHKIHTSTFWHQLLHWLGLMLAIYITSLFVDSGVMGSVQAGLVTLILLALAVFLAGVYTSAAFMFIGVTLMVFAGAASYVEAYLSVMMIPLFLVVAGIVYLIMLYEKRKAKKS